MWLMLLTWQGKAFKLLPLQVMVQCFTLGCPARSAERQIFYIFNKVDQTSETATIFLQHKKSLSKQIFFLWKILESLWKICLSRLPSPQTSKCKNSQCLQWRLYLSLPLNFNWVWWCTGALTPSLPAPLPHGLLHKWTLQHHLLKTVVNLYFPSKCDIFVKSVIKAKKKKKKKKLTQCQFAFDSLPG